ncbi:MAG: hypothetical protein ACPGO5_04400 [Patescibacteria group bacterium]
MEQITTKPYQQVLMPWVVSDEYLNRVEQLSVKYGIAEEQDRSFVNLVQGVMKQQLPVTSIPQIAQTTLFMNREESRLFTKDLIGLLLLPVEVVFIEYDFDEMLEQYGSTRSEFKNPVNLESIQDEMAEIYETVYLETALNLLELEENKEDQEDTVEGEGEVNDEIMQRQAAELQQKLADHYTAIQSDNMKQKQDVFAKLFASDNDAFTKEFYKAINDRDIPGVIAGLWVIAQHGKLPTLLDDDRKIQGLLGKHLEKKFSQGVATHFYEHTSDVVYLAYFLRHLLLDTLDLSENDAGALVIHLLNEHEHATGQPLDMLAYGDMEKGSFVWRVIKETDGHLALE